jgi:hypothetical protein
MEQLLGLAEGWFDRGDAVPGALGGQLMGSGKGPAEAHAARARAGAALVAQTRAPVSTNGSLHELVAAKYVGLAAAGKVDEAFSYELLGKLLALERRTA